MLNQKIGLIILTIFFFLSIIILSNAGELIYSTFLGGSGLDDVRHGIAVDSAGNIYLTGWTKSVDFPTTAGTYEITSCGGSVNVFVTKFNMDSSSIIYSTLLGGSEDELGRKIVVDEYGNVYITGYTESPDFPTNGSIAYKTLNGTRDAFISKLDITGSQLLFSSYVGGSGTEEGRGIALDPLGSIYISGFTDSSNFPTTSGAYDVSYNGNIDFFVVKYPPCFNNLDYSTYIGGTNQEGDFSLYGDGPLAVDTEGNAYLAGNTFSSDYPVTQNAYDITYNSEIDAAVTKLNPSGTALVYSTFIGGGSSEDLHDMTVDENGNAYITGWTTSPDYPVSTGAFDGSHNGQPDVFVTKLNVEGSAIEYSTFIGGSEYDEAYGIAIDSARNACITGMTWSSNFPVTDNAFDMTYHDYGDVFVTVINSSGTGLEYSTYLGGSNQDGDAGTESGHLVLDTSGNIYVVGYTESPDFPVTSNAYDTSYNDGGDIFVTVIPMGCNIPPYKSKLPDLKLLFQEELNPALDLENYHMVSITTSYSILTNFLGLSSLNGSELNQSAYSSTTMGTNAYSLESPGKVNRLNNKVKYSSYLLNKFPRVIIDNRASLENTTIDLNQYVTPDIPPSWPEPVLKYTYSGDSGKITFSIISNLLTITPNNTLKGNAEIFIIATPDTTSNDWDKEIIRIYEVLNPYGMFKNASDTGQWVFEAPTGIDTQPVSGQLNTYNDASGILTFFFLSTDLGVKMTPSQAYWLVSTAGQWYTVRARVMSDIPNNTFSPLVFLYNGQPPSPFSVSAHALLSTPTTWTWLETSLYCEETGFLYPQLVIRNGNSIGNVYVDAIEVIMAEPGIELAYGNTRIKDQENDWDCGCDSTGWTFEPAPNTSKAKYDFSNCGGLEVKFTGNSNQGLKITGSTDIGVTDTHEVIPGRTAGMSLHFSHNGTMNKPVLLLSVYGTDIPGSTLIKELGATASVFHLPDSGELKTSFISYQPYIYGQVQVKNASTAKISLRNTYLHADMDLPNYWNHELFNE